MVGLRYDGQVAIITGAGKNIGRAHALFLAARGAKIVVNNRSHGEPEEECSAQRTVSEIRDLDGEAVAHFGDVMNVNTPEELMSIAIEQYGRIDIVRAHFIENKGHTIPHKEKKPLAWIKDNYPKLKDINGALNHVEGYEVFQSFVERRY